MSMAATEAYLDPNVGFVGADVLARKVPGLGAKEARRALRDVEVVQRFKKMRRPRVFRRISGPPYTFQIDVLHLPFGTRNKNYALAAVDVLSRYAFVRTMTSHVVDGQLLKEYEAFLADVERTPGAPKVTSVHGDDEFSAEKFRMFNQDRGILVMTFVSKHDKESPGDKLGILDRFARTLKLKISKWVEANNNPSYLGVLPMLVKNYNTTPHSALNGATPEQVFLDPELQARIRFSNALHNMRAGALQPDALLRPGDLVRYNQHGSSKFAKERPTFSRAVRKIIGRDYNKFIITNPSRPYRGVELLRVGAASPVIPAPSPNSPRSSPVPRYALRRRKGAPARDDDDTTPQAVPEPAAPPPRYALRRRAPAPPPVAAAPPRGAPRRPASEPDPRDDDSDAPHGPRVMSADREEAALRRLRREGIIDVKCSNPDCTKGPRAVATKCNYGPCRTAFHLPDCLTPVPWAVRVPWYCTKHDTFCRVCGERDKTKIMCSSCDDAYHLGCLKPPLKKAPAQEWLCPQCGTCVVCDKRAPRSELIAKCNTCGAVAHEGCAGARAGEVWYCPEHDTRCEQCQRTDDEANMLFCDEEDCEIAYHITCLKPVPKMPPEDENWFCPIHKNGRPGDYEACVKCLDRNRGLSMVQCYTCKFKWHIDCMKPPLKNVPKEKWFCPKHRKKPKRKVI